MDSQIIISGGGPIGSYLASNLKECSVQIMEEHSEIGKPVQCTGLVHPRVVELANAEESVLNIIKGFRLFFPDGRVLEVKTDEAKAVVIDRCRFDNICCDSARKSGAVINTDSRIIDFKREHNGLAVSYMADNKNNEINTNLLIGADGYKSHIGTCAGLGCAKEIVRGIQADLEVTMPDQDLVEVYVGKEVAPGFFAWILPCGEFTRVGVGISKVNGIPSKYLDSLIEKRGFGEVNRTQTYSGVIPIGYPKSTYADNIMIVGDAAAQTKPLSGGGLYTGMQCAKYAAETALDAVNSNNYGAAFLSAYEEKWKSEIGKELDRGMIIRKVFTGMSDKRLDEAGKLLDKPEAREIIATGDIDYPSKLARPLLKSVPSLMKLAPGALKTLLLGR